MKTAGELLRAAREKKNLDLAYISEVLKIREQYLDALEKGNYDIFSSSIYIKGFLKNYAKFLHVDEEEVLALYRREYASTEVSGIVLHPNHSVIRTIPFAIKPGFVVAFFSIVVVLAISFYLVFEYRLFSAAPSLIVTSPVSGQTISTTSIEVKGRTDPGNKVYINGTEIATIDINGNFDTSVALHANSNELSIVAINSLNKQSTQRLHVTESPSAIAASPAASPSQSTQMDGVLSVSTANTWVKLVVDGVTVKSQILSVGTRLTFTAKSEISVQTGDANDTNLSVNGVNAPFVNDGVTSSADVVMNQSGTVTFR